MIIDFLIKYFRNKYNNRVLFCDLDGTLIVTKSGKKFPIDKNDWKFKDGIKESLIKYNPKYIFIVSNQGGIEKGFVNKQEFLIKVYTIAGIIKDWVKNCEVEFDYCTSNNYINYFRKPNPGMVRNFISCYLLKRENCLMIGDASGKEGQFSDSDLKCAERAGIKYCDVDDFIKKQLGK